MGIFNKKKKGVSDIVRKQPMRTSLPEEVEKMNASADLDSENEMIGAGETKEQAMARLLERKNKVTIEEEVTKVNGKTTAEHMVISTYEYGRMQYTPTQYKNLVTAVFKHLDDEEIMHLIWEKHDLEHKEQECRGETMEAMLEELPPFLKSLVGKK